jgi:PRTRC genetic system protein A
MKNLVTYHLHQTSVLPPSDALFYQYVIAQNGVFVRTENDYVSACIPVTRLEDGAATIRGLQPLTGWVRLKIPRIPLALLNAAITDAQAPTEDGRLDETLAYVIWRDGRHRLLKPDDQRATPTAVASKAVEIGETVVMDIHSHGATAPYFSPTDNMDETRLRFYGVIGNLKATPRWRFRLGIYGHWMEVARDELFA